MAYDQKIELIRARLLSVVGAANSGLDIMTLWDRYLTATGFTGGTILDRQARAARTAGVALPLYVSSGAILLGPELAGTVTDGAWTFSLNGGAAGTVTQDGTGLHFAGSKNIAAAIHTIAGVDNAAFRVSVTCPTMTQQGFRPIVYGATNTHSGTGTTRNTTGTFTEILQTTGGGSFNNQIRIQATGTSDTQNTFDISDVSVKRVF